MQSRSGVRSKRSSSHLIRSGRVGSRRSSSFRLIATVGTCSPARVPVAQRGQRLAKDHLAQPVHPAGGGHRAAGIPPGRSRRGAGASSGPAPRTRMTSPVSVDTCGWNQAWISPFSSASATSSVSRPATTRWLPLAGREGADGARTLRCASTSAHSAASSSAGAGRPRRSCRGSAKPTEAVT